MSPNTFSSGPRYNLAHERVILVFVEKLSPSSIFRQQVLKHRTDDDSDTDTNNQVLNGLL